jgi:hypothetical protein
MTMSTAGKIRGSQTGRAVNADAEGSAGKGQPPATGQARYRVRLVRAAGGNPFQRVGIVLPVFTVATKKLERNAAPVETGQTFLELR